MELVSVPFPIMVIGPVAWHPSRATNSTSFGGESARPDPRTSSRAFVDRTSKQESTGLSPDRTPVQPAEPVEREGTTPVQHPSSHAVRTAVAGGAARLCEQAAGERPPRASSRVPG
ncbi:MAG: hypothetical protein ACK55O_14670, partial [Phycisphaerales bacterium]